jgi:hypothetical protein
VVKGVKVIFGGVQMGWGLQYNPIGKLKFRTLMLIISKWSGQVHVTKKERSRRRIIIRRRNGAKTISLQTLFGRLNSAIIYGHFG